MPATNGKKYASSAQRRFIYAQAAAGVAWARKWITDVGDPLPDLRAHVQAAMSKKTRK